jgi:hypothetical protein
MALAPMLTTVYTSVRGFSKAQLVGAMVKRNVGAVCAHPDAPRKSHPKVVVRMLGGIPDGDQTRQKRV